MVYSRPEPGTRLWPFTQSRSSGPITRPPPPTRTSDTRGRGPGRGGGPAGRSRRRQRRVRPIPGGAAAGQEPAAGRIQRAQAMTQTEDFRRWFAGSRIQNTAGGPLLVFHGAGRRFLPPLTPEGGPCGSPQTRHTRVPTPPGPGGWSRHCRRRRFTGGTRLIPAYLRAENPADVGQVNRTFGGGGGGSGGAHRHPETGVAGRMGPGRAAGTDLGSYQYAGDGKPSAEIWI